MPQLSVILSPPSPVVVTKRLLLPRQGYNQVRVESMRKGLSNVGEDTQSRLSERVQGHAACKVGGSRSATKHVELLSG